MDVPGRAAFLGNQAFPGNPRACVLPKSSPYVGHYRHAPPSPVHAELAERLQNLLSRREKKGETKVKGLLSPLPRDSPFVGTQRHAPQSPKMQSPKMSEPPSPMCLEPAFSSLSLNDDGPLGLFFLEDNILDLDDGEEDEECFCLRPLFANIYQDEELCVLKPFCILMKPQESLASIDTYFPHTTLCQIMKLIMTTKMLGSLLSVNRAFAEAAKSPLAWQGIPVVLPPSADLYTEEITNVCNMWAQAEKIVMPRCSDLFAELLDACPDVKLEMAWRFDRRLKGCGVTVKNHGTTACQTHEDKVVVLGDAPIRNSYLEIVLDEHDDDMSWENPNDFGLGVTASRAKAREQMNCVEVAGEVPHSWVVDFSKNSIVLVINNELSEKYEMFGGEDLRKGDCVGLLFEPQAIRVYVNGTQEACLKVPANATIEGSLYPVFDLYGRTKQMTRSLKDGIKPRVTPP